VKENKNNINDNSLESLDNNHTEIINNTPKISELSNHKNVNREIIPILETTENKMNKLNRKYNRKIRFNFDIEYDNLKPEILQEVIRSTLLFLPTSGISKNTSIQTGGDLNNNYRYQNLLQLRDIHNLSPNIKILRNNDKITIVIENLSEYDYQKLTNYKSRFEEYVNNKYLDKIEEIEPEKFEVEKYDNIKFYDKKNDNNIDFYNGEGQKVYLIEVQNRVINVNRIKRETKILYTKVLNPIPENIKKKGPSLLNKIKSGTSSTFQKIKNSFHKLISSDKNKIEPIQNNDENSNKKPDNIKILENNKEPERNNVNTQNQNVEEITCSRRNLPVEAENNKPPPKKRTQKNNYTFHQIPEKRKYKNSTIKHSSTVKKSKKKPILKSKLQKKKLKKKEKKIKKHIINNIKFHRIKKR
jgi:hypothetical protein